VSIKGVLWRFLLVYTALIVAAGLAMNYFGMKSNSGINIGLLAGSIVWVCGAFGKRNKRYFTDKEKSVVVLGLVAIDLTLQLLLGAAALSQSPTGLNINALILAVGLVGILHAIAIYFFVGLAKKPLIKQGIIDG
jgi:hypothetical protein